MGFRSLENYGIRHKFFDFYGWICHFPSTYCRNHCEFFYISNHWGYEEADFVFCSVLIIGWSRNGRSIFLLCMILTADIDIGMVSTGVQ